jgi:hypothetical protein
MDKTKNCFVISPIGSTDSPQRKRADIVLKHIFKPALEPLGYIVVRADEISQPGSITLQVLERVLESELVIADLTDHNPNVFYELAVRHASQKPVIHVIASEQKIPFDVADLRTIPIDVDLDGADRARQQIIAQTNEIEAGNLGETPVKLAGVLKHLASGKSDEKVILKQILDGITELRSDFRKEVPQLLASNANITRKISSLQHRKQNTENVGDFSGLLAEKKLLVRALLDQKLGTLGDSVISLETQDSVMDDEAYVDFIVKTKMGKMQVIGFQPNTNPDSIANIIFNLMTRHSVE